MKTIFQKDLRENLKLALIGFAIFTLLLIQAYQSSITAFSNLLKNNGSITTSTLQPLLSQTLLTEVAFFCAFFAAVLGWLQTRNEAHRDLWAFLVHRPVSRAEIFRGKVAAGLCLYALGAGLPLLVLILVVQTPGHVAAPFEWAMILPLLGIFLTGPVYYLAGMLTGLRQARWYGSKCFGVGLGLFASIAVFSVPQIWGSLAVIVFAFAILVLAMRGAYQTGGFYEGQTTAGKLALIVATLAGGGVLLFVVVGLVLTIAFRPFMQSSHPYSSYTMLSNGTIYQTTYQDNELLSVVDLEGQPLLGAKTGKPIDRRELQNRTAYGATVLSELDKPNPFGSRYIFYPFTIYFNLWNVVDKKLWYVDRHGRLIGYDGVTRKFIGTIEPHGLDGVAEKFLKLSRANGGYFYNNYYNDPSRTLVSARTVYEIDLKSRAISPVYAVTNGDEIGGFANSARNYPDGHASKPILITTRKSITLLKSDGGVIFEIPYAPNLSDYPRVELFSLWQPTNGFALELDPDYNLNATVWLVPIQT